MRDAKELLEQYYLEMRWRCLSLAADLDRLQRAAGGAEALRDPRVEKLRRGIAALLEEGATADRAARVQEIFTDRTPAPAYQTKKKG